jgi:hypothetical protein
MSLVCLCFSCLQLQRADIVNGSEQNIWKLITRFVIEPVSLSVLTSVHITVLRIYGYQLFISNPSVHLDIKDRIAKTPSLPWRLLRDPLERFLQLREMLQKDICMDA